MTPKEFMSAFACRLDMPTADMIGTLPDVTTQIMADRYTNGGEAVDGVLPLHVALLEPWPTDVHFTMYHGPGVRAVKSQAARYDVQFDFIAYDLDFDKHRDEPTADDFALLVAFLPMMGTVANFDAYCPNIVYQTRRGARIIYYIDPCTDVEWFEAHYAAFMDVLNEIISKSSLGYQLDTCTRDWVRLFRSSRVVRDGKEEFGHEIRVFHHGRLDLDGFRAKPKRTPRPFVGNQKFTTYDPKLLRLIKNGLQEGSRNNELFKALCYVYRKYDTNAAEKWVAILHDRAIDAGLTSREFEQVNKSAQQQRITTSERN